jgi:hypothetical protein
MFETKEGGIGRILTSAAATSGCSSVTVFHNLALLKLLPLTKETDETLQKLVALSDLGVPAEHCCSFYS